MEIKQQFNMMSDERKRPKQKSDIKVAAPIQIDKMQIEAYQVKNKAMRLLKLNLSLGI